MKYSTILSLAEETGIKTLYPGYTDGLAEVKDKYPFFLISFIPYTLEDNSAPAKKAQGYIAPFAQANHYAELTNRFKKLVTIICSQSSYKKSDFRVFANSPLPEKKMAIKSGLGIMGKNGLIIHPKYGSYISLGGVMLPFVPDELLPAKTRKEQSLQDPCKACTSCIKACPTGALTAEGLQKELCIQYYASTHTKVPVAVMKKWGNTLYGCPHCQAACPHNKKTSPPREKIQRGRIGSQLSLELILTAQPEQLKSMLRGSTLGTSWLKPQTIIRNAILAAAHSKDSSLIQLIQKHSQSGDIIIKKAADWTISYINQNIK